MSSLSLSAPSDNVNVNAFHVFSRLFFIVGMSTSLLAIAFSQTGSSWIDSATVHYTVKDSSVTYPQTMISADLTSYSMLGKDGSATTLLLSDYLLKCVYTGSANQLPSNNCVQYQGLVGITIFVRILFAVLLLTLAYIVFLVAETLLLGWGKEGGLSSSRPALFLPLLAAAIFSVTITVAVPVAYSVYFSAFINSNLAVPGNTNSYVQSQRPGSSWYMTASASVFLIYALYSLFAFERKQGTSLFTCKASAPAAKLETV